jgi:hypothetical protein
MNTRTLLTILLIASGILALVYQGVTVVSREKVIDLGPLQVTAERTRTLPILPVFGAAALIGGVVLLLARKPVR